jgi:hypothetical protein
MRTRRTPVLRALPALLPLMLAWACSGSVDEEASPDAGAPTSSDAPECQDGACDCPLETGLCGAPPDAEAEGAAADADLDAPADANVVDAMDADGSTSADAAEGGACGAPALSYPAVTDVMIAGAPPMLHWRVVPIGTFVLVKRQVFGDGSAVPTSRSKTLAFEDGEPRRVTWTEAVVGQPATYARGTVREARTADTNWVFDVTCPDVVSVPFDFYPDHARGLLRVKFSNVVETYAPADSVRDGVPTDTFGLTCTDLPQLGPMIQNVATTVKYVASASVPDGMYILTERHASGYLLAPEAKTMRIETHGDVRTLEINHTGSPGGRYGSLSGTFQPVDGPWMNFGCSSPPIGRDYYPERYSFDGTHLWYLNRVGGPNLIDVFTRIGEADAGLEAGSGAP